MVYKHEIYDFGKIAFLIVTYRELFYESKTYLSLLKSIRDVDGQNFSIYIFDNTDTTGWQVSWEHLEEKDCIRYYADSTNPGLPKAYNFVSREAAEEGKEWIVFMDQDTEFPITAAKTYHSSMKSSQQNIFINVPVLYVNNKIFSPLKLFLKRAITLRKIDAGIYELRRLSFVNSGMMVHISFLLKIGGYNEKLILDFADYQFLDKARAYTKFFQVLPFSCSHDSSTNDRQLSKALKRYAIYVKDLTNCEKRGFLDYLGYYINDIFHLIKLTVVFRSIKFLQIYIQQRFN